jgi:hypothetical protein
MKNKITARDDNGAGRDAYRMLGFVGALAVVEATRSHIKQGTHICSRAIHSQCLPKEKGGGYQ